MNQNQPKNFSLWETLKGMFFLLIFAQVIFAMVPKFKKALEDFENPKTKIALIDVKGMITNSNQWVREIRHAYKEKSIKGVLLKIDSGGGAAGSSELVFKELKRISEKKPVVALVENSCASGAYLIACGANKIISQRMSSVGHVGVLMMMPNIKKLLNNNNIDFEVPHSGEFKTTGMPFVDKPNEQQKKYIQGHLDKNYNSFVEIVANERNLDKAKHKDWANGKIFTGDEALEKGIVDQLGDLKDAEDELRDLLKNPKLEFEFVRQPKPSPIAAIMGSSDPEETTPDAIPLAFFNQVATFLKNQLMSSSIPTII